MTAPRQSTDPADAAELLAAGGVVILPTDTLPGFHARADRVEAVARIAAIKGQRTGKAFLVLAADAVQAGTVAGPLDARQRAYADLCWPGPFSLVLPARPSLPAAVTGGGMTVAVRVPDHPELAALVAAAGFPLVSTSVNRTGEPPASDLASAVQRHGDEVDGVWEGPQPGTAERAVPSALVDLTVWPPRELRPGARPLPPVSGGDLDLPGQGT